MNAEGERLYRFLMRYAELIPTLGAIQAAAVALREYDDDERNETRGEAA